jgi:hypothetical protein
MIFAAFKSEPGVLVLILFSVVYRVYPLDPMPSTHWDATAAIVLGAIGVLVQLAVTARGRE